MLAAPVRSVPSPQPGGLSKSSIWIELLELSQEALVGPSNWSSTAQHLVIVMMMVMVMMMINTLCASSRLALQVERR